MADVVIRFSSDRELLVRSLTESKEEAEELLEYLKKDVGEQLRQDQQNVLNLRADQIRAEKTSDQMATMLEMRKENVDQQAIRMENLKQTFDTLQKDRLMLEEDIKKQGIEFEEAQRMRQQLDERASETIRVLSQELPAKLQAAEGRMAQLKRDYHALDLNLRNAAGLVSALSGGVSLLYAITGETMASWQAAAISMATSTLSQILLIQSLGAVSGNWALVFATGALASSAASSINTIRSLGDQQQARYDADRRRMSQRLIK